MDVGGSHQVHVDIAIVPSGSERHDTKLRHFRRTRRHLFPLCLIKHQGALDTKSLHIRLNNALGMGVEHSKNLKPRGGEDCVGLVPALVALGRIWLDAGQAISKCSEHQIVEQARIWLGRAQRTACCHPLPDCHYEMVPNLGYFLESQRSVANGLRGISQF